MDIARIRALMKEAFPPEERHALHSEAGLGEAALVLQALKSLFAQELATLPSPETAEKNKADDTQV